MTTAVIHYLVEGKFPSGGAMSLQDDVNRIVRDASQQDPPPKWLSEYLKPTDPPEPNIIFTDPHTIEAIYAIQEPNESAERAGGVVEELFEELSESDRHFAVRIFNIGINQESIDSIAESMNLPCTVVQHKKTQLLIKLTDIAKHRGYANQFTR